MIKRPEHYLQTPLIETQLHPPRQADMTVDRPRLIDLFSLGRFRKLTLVQAPAGFGKTTLLIQWRKDLLSARCKVAWYSIDEDDNTFVQFFSYVIAALQVAHPRICQGAQVLLQVGPSIPEKTIISTMINELTGVEQHTILIIDDYHLISNPDINKAFKLFLDHLPRYIHVIIAGRSEPAFQIADLRVQGQLYEVGEEDLRFTTEESHILLNENNKLDLEKKDVQKLHKLCGGWAAGLQLSAISLQGRKDSSAFIDSFSGSFQSVREYLAVDVLDKQPEPIVDFLLKTAILNRFSPDLANHVVGIDNSSEVLGKLERSNLFLQRLDEKGNWFRYHQVFAQFLQDRLEKKMPDHVRRLHKIACEWFAEKGFSLEALQHALAADDIPTAAELIEDCAMAFLSNGQPVTLIGLVNKLTESHWKNRPRIQMALGWAFIVTQQLRKCEEMVGRVEMDLHPDQSEEDKATYIEIRAIRAGIAAFRNDYIRAEREATQCMAFSEKCEPYVAGVVGNVLTYAYYHLGNLNKAREAQTWAFKYHRLHNNTYAKIYSKVFIGMLDSAEGLLAEAAEKFESAYQLAEDTGEGASIAAALPAAFLYNLSYEWNDMSSARQLVDDGLDLIDIGSLVDVLVACYIPHALWLFFENKPDQSFALLERLEAVGHHRNSRWLLAEVLNVKVRIFMAQGNYLRAESLLTNYRDTCRQREFPFPDVDLLADELEGTVQARVMMAQGNPGEAANILSKLLTEAKAFGFFRRSIGLMVLLAVAHYRNSEKEQALHFLCRALLHAQFRNMIRTFVDEGKPVLNLLQMLHDAWDNKDYQDARAELRLEFVEQLLAAFGQKPAEKGRDDRTGIESGTDIENELIETLSSREQEILEILASGVTNKEIAEILSISTHTVKYHLINIYGKLGVNNRTEAVNEARLLGLLES